MLTVQTLSGRLYRRYPTPPPFSLTKKRKGGAGSPGGTPAGCGDQKGRVPGLSSSSRNRKRGPTCSPPVWTPHVSPRAFNFYFHLKTLSTGTTSAFTQLGLGGAQDVSRGTKPACPHIPPEAPCPPVPTAQHKCLGRQESCAGHRSWPGEGSLAVHEGKQNKPVVSAERKGKRARACSSRALLNARSHWNNDQSLRACCI